MLINLFLIFLKFRTTAITGFLPQELIGCSAYEFFHQEDLNSIAVRHKKTLQGETVTTEPYRFRCKGGHFVPLRTKSTAFRNPWSKELEFIVCNNMVITWVWLFMFSLSSWTYFGKIIICLNCNICLWSKVGISHYIKKTPRLLLHAPLKSTDKKFTPPTVQGKRSFQTVTLGG